MSISDHQIPAFISPRMAARIASILLPPNPPGEGGGIAPQPSLRMQGKVFLALCLMQVSWQRQTAVALRTVFDSMAEGLLWKTAAQLADSAVFRVAEAQGRVPPLHAADAEIFARAMAERTGQKPECADVLRELVARAITLDLELDEAAKDAALVKALADDAEPSFLATLLLIKPGSRRSEREALPAIELAGPPATGGVVENPTPHVHPVYNPEAVRAHLNTHPPAQTQGEGSLSQARLLHSMGQGTGLRPLRQAPEDDVLGGLYARFPHFEAVLDFIARNLALAGCGEEGRTLRLAPVLLRGAPGTGKTYFAQELARLMGVEFLERDLSVSTEAFVLSGMDSAWKNSKPGLVFDALVNGPTANPLILLNEVDKAAATGTHNSAISALYALLEPASARRFVDEFATVSVDASRVNWVLTANEGYIPEPILSRTELFEIPAPTPEQCRQIAASVWADICRQVLPRGHHFDPVLPVSLIGEVGRLSPRVMRKALTAAAGVAALDGRAELTLDDLTTVRARYSAPAKTPIGFTSSASR